MEELAILLEACEPHLNRYRFWRVRMGRDLFGRWNVRVTAGRIGGSGRTFRYDFGLREDAAAFVETRLKRRRGAPHRCGAAYRLIEASSGTQGFFDPDTIRTLIESPPRRTAQSSAAEAP
jgi:hypothetical protein